MCCQKSHASHPYNCAIWTLSLRSKKRHFSPRSTVKKVNVRIHLCVLGYRAGGVDLSHLLHHNMEAINFLTRIQHRWLLYDELVRLGSTRLEKITLDFTLEVLKNVKARHFSRMFENGLLQPSLKITETLHRSYQGVSSRVYNKILKIVTQRLCLQIFFKKKA